MSYTSKYTGEEIDSLLEEIDRGDGSYPDMKVGDLCGHGESVPAEFTFRASGGKSIKDGSATIKELQGNAVVWNNMIDTRDRQGDSGFVYMNDYLHLIEGHKYAMIREKANDGFYCIPVINGSEIYDYSLRNGEFAKIFTSAYTTTPSTTRMYCEQNVGKTILCDLTLMFGAGNEPTTIEEFNARKPIVADEYAYNEGEVIAFNGDAIKSVGDNAWEEQWENGTFNTTTGENINNDQVRCKNPIKVLPNERYHFSRKTSGEMWVIFYDKSGNVIEKPSYEGNSDGNSISLNPAWISEFTTPSNADTMRFYMTGNYGNTYKHDIMLTLVHSGWKVDTNAGYQPYWADTLQIDSRIKDAFPQGMHKWDKVYNKDGKGYIVKGTGSVDLGDLKWTYYPAATSYPHGFFLATPENRKLGRTNLICSRYSHGYFADDKSIMGNSGAYNIYIMDSAYTDAATFKTTVQGVMLYYELAEPTTIEYDKPFKLDYKVADFGTEELISAQPSAPFRARTIYQFNAVDQIRENAIKIQQLETLLTTMQAQMANITNN